MGGCIFCRIGNGEIKAKILYEDARIVAFEDNKPAAPVHIVVIPRRHIERVSDITEGDEALAGRLVTVAAKLAKDNKISDSGYRLVLNCNKDAGQAVFHLHLHLLGGRAFAWPPG